MFLFLYVKYIGESRISDSFSFIVLFEYKSTVSIICHFQFSFKPGFKCSVCKQWYKLCLRIVVNSIS